VAVFSGKVCSVASFFVSFSLISKDFSLAGSEGLASVSTWLFAVSASVTLVSDYVFGASAVFLEVELVFIVSSASSTLTILFLLGVAVRPFCAFGTVTPAEGLVISDIFVPSTPILSAFGSAILA
jgi:hypothetical protein